MRHVLQDVLNVKTAKLVRSARIEHSNKTEDVNLAFKTVKNAVMVLYAKNAIKGTL